MDLLCFSVFCVNIFLFILNICIPLTTVIIQILTDRVYIFMSHVLHVMAQLVEHLPWVWEVTGSISFLTKDFKNGILHLSYSIIRTEIVVFWMTL